MQTPQVFAPATTTAQQKVSTYCSCVEFARLMGVKFPGGMNASDFTPFSTPVVGGLVLFHYAKSGLDHVAVITGFSSDGNLEVMEANYHHCQKDTRIVNLADPSIRGFWSAK